jgi:hypothetical protein
MRYSLAARKSFLLRIDPEMLEALRRWAGDDLRSVNGQMEFLLRRALSEAGRLPKQKLARGRNPKPRTRRGKQTPE